MDKSSEIIIIIIAFAAGAAIGVGFYRYSPPPEAALAGMEMPEINDPSFVPANVTILGNELLISSGCAAISFNVTDDQAYSIDMAASNMTAARPLTHDIMIDVIGNFNISIMRVRIENYGNEIYYARTFLQRSNQVLDIDMRPSDAVALALRTGSVLYANKSMMSAYGTDIC